MVYCRLHRRRRRRRQCRRRVGCRIRVRRPRQKEEDEDEEAVFTRESITREGEIDCSRAHVKLCK